jgi:hypothetical protein
MKGLIFSILAISDVTAFAHGQDKPGPHGGAIQMPGAFHTEVVEKNGSFEIYLLDMGFTNASVKDAAVEAFIVSNGKRTNLGCVKGAESFICKTPTRPPKTGQLRIIAKRENSQGNEVTYDLPVKPIVGGAM